MFCVINKCDNDSKEWCFLLKTNDYQEKMYDTKRIVTKMGVTIISFFICVELKSRYT
jgi:hypothetical protein